MFILNLDTFLVALYTIIDDLYKDLNPYPVLRPGRKEIITDSEILTLAICSQWLNLSERKFIRYVKAHWQVYFPKSVTQSQYNRRFHSLGKTMASLITAASAKMTAYFKVNYLVMDTIGVPLMKRCRGKYHRLFPEEIANFGFGGSDREWYYGIKLALVVSPEGIITGFILAPASNSDRWLAEYLLCYRNNQFGQPARVEDLPLSHKAGYKRVGPTGEIWPKDGVGVPASGPYLVDLGFNGKWWVQHWRLTYGAIILAPDDYEGEMVSELKHKHYSCRQIVETVNEHLSDEFHLSQIGARSKQGLLARIAAKLLSFNLGVWLNKLFNRPQLATSTLFSW
jgi:hypothetical protein